MKKFHLLIISMIIVMSVTAQMDSVSSIQSSVEEESMEDYVRRNESTVDFSDINGLNEFFKRGKLNINDATEDELTSLHLNELQIVNLISYREKYGALTGIYELNLVEGFDSALILKLEPRITFRMNRELHKITPESLTKFGKHSLMGRWNRITGEQKGYINNTYAGSPDKLLFKYGYKFYNRLRFGFIMEKDPGESLKHGFDFYSTHLFYQGKGFVRTIALGDYYVRFGQGLTVNNSFSLFNDMIPSVPTSPLSGIRPSSGANESSFFRGSAITIAPLRQSRLTLFWSQKRLDAGTAETVNLNDSVFVISNAIRSIHETGLHRTAAELADKGITGQTIMGGNINSSIGIFRIGLTAVNTRYSGYIDPRPELYNQFRFRGRTQTSYGFDIRALIGDLTISSEISKCDHGGIALLASMQYLPYSDFGFVLNYRNFERNYSNMYSNVWSQSSACSNEEGISAGLFYIPAKYFTISAWTDHYKHPWLSYGVDSPSSGLEYLVKLTYAKLAGEEFQIRYSFNRKPMGTAMNDRHNFRFDLRYHPFSYIVFKNRIEIVINKVNLLKPTNGFLIYQDVIIKPKRNLYQFYLRYALFSTNSFADRIYTREDEVPFCFSVTPYYYSGSRFYITGMYALNRDIDIWLRYSHDYYPGKTIIGTGNDEMQGNTRSEVSIQLMIKL